MNTAVRAIPGQVGQGLRINLSLGNMIVAMLFVAVLITAFGVVYIKDSNRRMFIHWQNLQQQQQQYQVQWGKLLLEEGALTTQSRIQAKAQRLGMVVPQAKDIVMVEEE